MFPENTTRIEKNQFMLDGRARERFLSEAGWEDELWIYKDGEKFKVKNWKDAGGYTFVTVYLPKKIFNPY